MTPSQKATSGRFVWHDLMTPDPEASIGFYSAMFGWNIREVDMGEFGKYKMIHHGERGIGGVVPLEADAGVPPHWITYVTVPSVDKAAESAPGLGGQVCVPPTDIPNVGRFAVIADSTGAFFSPFSFPEGQEPPEREGPPERNDFCWYELLARDTGVESFYKEMLGWTTEKMDMGPAGTYTVFRRDGKDTAGMIPMPGDAEGPSAWLVYVSTDDVDRAAAKIKELGGCLYVEPRDIPNVGRFSVGADPTGAMFAVYRAAA